MSRIAERGQEIEKEMKMESQNQQYAAKGREGADDHPGQGVEESRVS